MQFLYRYSVVCGGNPILGNYGYVNRKIRISEIKRDTTPSVERKWDQLTGTNSILSNYSLSDHC